MSFNCVVVDTNVAITANGKANQANTQCVSKCLHELVTIRNAKQVLLDDKGLILQEYLKQKPHGFPQGAGDAFLVWVYDNQANSAHVRIVPVTPLNGGSMGFAEFPNDSELFSFDQDDRKFVAVALASKTPTTILNATDTDWWIHRKALSKNGVQLKFLCRQLMTDEDE